MSRRVVGVVLIGVVAAVAARWIGAGRESGSRRSGGARTVADSPTDGKRVLARDAKAFRTLWAAAGEERRRRMVAEIVAAGSQADSLIDDLLQSVEKAEWGEEALYRALGPCALDALVALALLEKLDQERREAAFNLVIAVAEGAVECEFLARCIHHRDAGLRNDAADHIAANAPHDFSADMPLRRALCRAVANPDEEDTPQRLPPGVQLWGPSSTAGIIWDALNSTLDVEGHDLRTLLRDPDPDVQAGALLVVYSWFGSGAPPDDPDASDQYRRARGDGLVADLLPLLADDDARVRAGALHELRYLAGDEIPVPMRAVLDRLADRDEDDQVRAAAAATRASVPADAIRDLLPFANDEPAAVRAAAMAGIGVHQRAAPPDASLAQLFGAALTDPDARVRAAGASALGYHAARPGSPWRDGLLAGLEDPEEAVRLACVRALHQRGAPAVEAARHLERWVETGSRMEQYVALNFLMDLEQRPASRKVAMLALMRRADERFHLALLRALGRQPGIHEGVRDVALESTKDDAPLVRLAACELLMRRFVMRPDARSALREALSDSDDRVASYAVEQCTAQGFALTAAIAAGLRLFRDRNTRAESRDRAVRALARQHARDGAAIGAALVDWNPKLGTAWSAEERRALEAALARAQAAPPR